MSRIWRWIAPVAVAGGLVAGVPAIQAATAGTAATSIITISATSHHYPGLRHKNDGLVDGHAIVIYRDTTNSANTGIVSGKVTTTATNDTATLLAEPFGAKTYSAVGTPISLTPTNGVARYSFNVTPSVATQYKVQLSGTDSAASGVVPIYVIAYEPNSKSQSCTRTRCTFSIRLYTYVPTSQAYKTEAGKHWYLYQAVWYGPHEPKNYTLSTTARASSTKKVNGREFVHTFTWYIPLRNGSGNWSVQACTKDTESKDGLGLKGHHGCGDKHVSTSAIYLG